MIVMWSANYYAYFTTDLRRDAFLLNFPYWYVNFEKIIFGPHTIENPIKKNSSIKIIDKKKLS